MDLFLFLFLNFPSETQRPIEKHLSALKKKKKGELLKQKNDLGRIIFFQHINIYEYAVETP